MGSERRLIVRYYQGDVPDNLGRYLTEIQSWPDDLIERVHDFIQWMFPLREPSGFNSSAPILDECSINEFRSRPDLQGRLRVSLQRMLDFYGLELVEGEVIEVRPSADFAAQSCGWLQAGNHNHLRLTRMIKSLNALGLEPEARALASGLAAIHRSHRDKISNVTAKFWSDAGEGR